MSHNPHQSGGYSGPIELASIRQESLTAQLRWSDGVLEQAWDFLVFKGGTVIDRGTTWRPVPKAP